MKYFWPLFFLSCINCSTILSGQQIILEKDHCNLWGKETGVESQEITLKFNDFDVLKKKSHGIYNQCIKPTLYFQQKIYVYSNLGIVLYVSEYESYEFGLRKSYKRIKSVHLIFNSRSHYHFCLKGQGKQGAKMNKYYSLPIKIAGTEILPMTSFDDIFSDGQPLSKYFFHRDVDKTYGVLLMDYFHITMDFDEEKLVELNFSPLSESPIVK